MGLLTFLFIFVSSAQNQPACDVKTLFEQHKDQLPSDKARIETGDGSFLNPFFTGEMSPQDYDLPKRSFKPGEVIPTGPQTLTSLPRTPQNTQALFKSLQEAMIQEIKGTSVEITESQKLMIERVKNLKLKLTDDCSALATNTTA
ncbi:MAG: hypothetical protein IT287_07620, partial [Bdellovibrionaceae bacterium]|nr:hypothetical protein [Pseudobdellovibrionaceae bacterium]